jgi:3-oxoacyl-[acyl-carrier protein] reductase
MNAVIIGGSRGVGLAIATQLANNYENICIVSRDKKNLDKALVSIGATKSKFYIYQGDVAQKGFGQELSKFLSDQGFGVTSTLICNAGGPPQKLFLDTTEADWDSVIETSLLGQIRVVREFLPQMIKLNFGRVVFVSSTVAKEPSPMMVLSATARSGLSAFVKAISTEFARSNITMNVICLGGVLTERLNSLIENSANQQKIDVSTVREKLVESIPVGRFAEPKEIANMVTFLVSQEASYITGTSISIDGGLSKAFF